MRFPFTIAVSLAMLIPPQVRAHDPAEARYLGNEGIMVTRGRTKILFDAFYAESFEGKYTLVPDATEAKMMKGEPPFDGVDAIFVSHIHPDHFNTRKIIAYLRAHPRVVLYAGIDVQGAIRAADVSANDPMLKRIAPVNIAPGATAAHFDIAGLAVEAFAIPHSGGNPVPNYAYRVTMDGATTVMHLGDADSAERHYVPYQQDFDRKRTDVAFVPYWLLLSESGKRVLEQRIRPLKAVGIHVEAEERKHPDQTRRETGIDLFIEPGETRAIPDRPR